MPISADQFEEIDDGPSPGTNAYEILSFLRRNTDQAFTRSEIAEVTGVPSGSVGPTLVRLRERGRDDHRGTYWRVSDHERSLDAAAGHADSAVASREEEPLDYDQWQTTRSISASDVSSSEPFRKGDVFWAPDPFREGSNPQLWVVLAADSLPYLGEEYVCAALTTSDLPGNLEVGEDWVAGGDPETTSYYSPWVVATIKHDAVVSPQGELTGSFVDQSTSARSSWTPGERPSDPVPSAIVPVELPRGGEGRSRRAVPAVGQ